MATASIVRRKVFLTKRGFESGDAGVKRTWSGEAVPGALVNRRFIVGFLCYRRGKPFQRLTRCAVRRNVLAQIRNGHEGISTSQATAHLARSLANVRAL